MIEERGRICLARRDQLMPLAGTVYANRNLVSFALRRPSSLLMWCLRQHWSIFRAGSHGARHFSDLGVPCFMLAQTLRRHGPGADGRVLVTMMNSTFSSSPASSTSKATRARAWLLKIVPYRDQHGAGGGGDSFYVDRARDLHAYGNVPPFVLRFDGAAVAGRHLVFSSKTRPFSSSSAADFQGSPTFATLPGGFGTYALGSSQRTIVIRRRFPLN